MKHNLFMPEGLDALKAKMYTTHRKKLRRLLDQCERYDGEKLPEEHPMKSITYFAMASANLSLAYKLTGQEKYLKEAKRWIFQAVAYPHWGRAIKVDVDLSAAWLLFGLGLCYDWLKDDLTAEERKLLLDKLILQGERMHNYSITQFGTCWPTSYWQNHNWIDFAGLAVTGYAIVDEHKDAQKWIDTAREDLEFVFPLLPEDGSDYEGVVYWRYGVIWLAIYAEALRQAEGIDLFKTSDFLRNTVNFRIYQSAPDLERIINFGDCHDTRSGHTCALYYKVASEYNNPHAQWFADHVLDNFLGLEGHESGVKPGLLPEAFLEFLWYNPSIEKTPVSELPVEAFYEDLGVYSYRTGWDDDAQAFSFKCSSCGGHKQWRMVNALEAERGYKIQSTSHHHPDANSFVLINGKDYMLTDEGYSAEKWTRHHNLVVVDGQGYEGDGQKEGHSDLDVTRTCQVEEYKVLDSHTYIKAQSGLAYKKALELTCNQREVLRMKNGYYLLCDTLESKLPHTYSALFHSDAKATISDNIATVVNGESTLQIFDLSKDSKFNQTITSISATPTSQEPGNVITHDTQTLMIENAEKATNFKFMTLINAHFNWKDGISCTKVALSAGEVICVNGKDFTDYIVYNPTKATVNETVSVNGKDITVKTSEIWTVL